MASAGQHAWNNGPRAWKPLHYQRPKLTPQQRDEVRRRLDAGERAVDLAVEYGVSRGAIGHCR
ncbi:Hin recombinase [Streptomyces olivaceoviridis]|uniref:Hin recombinase n=1 Tax=Streptomyces olivaceoviridis TaxID=1921 RepID=UPI0036A758CB